MATNLRKTTTVLGKTYEGIPYGLAFDLWKLVQNGQTEKAHRLLLAKNRINAAFGHPEYSLDECFSSLPMEGGFTVRVIDQGARS